MKSGIRNFNIIYLFIIIIAWLLPFIFGFYYIKNYGIDVPVWDQWPSIVSWTIAYYEGNFHLINLLDLQNDSRPVLPNLIIVITSLLTSLNIKTMFYIGFVFYICCAAFIIYIFKRDSNLDNLALSILLIPIIYYMLNPYYMVRFIYNIGSIQYPILILTAITTIYLLYFSKKSWIYFLASIFTAILCTFSFVAGLSIWLSGLVQLGIQDMHRKKIKIYMWSISTLLIFYIYFISLGFTNTGLHSKDAYYSFLDALFHYPIHKFLCFMGTLGAQVIHQIDIALYFGLIFLIFFIILIYINIEALNLDRFAKWYGLLAFGILTSIQVTLTRSGSDSYESYLGPADTIFFIPDVRHSLAIFLPIICFYALSILYTKASVKEQMTETNRHKAQLFFLERRHKNLILLGIVLTLISLGTILHVIPGLEEAEFIRTYQVTNQYYLQTYTIQPDKNLEKFYHSAATVRDYAALLEKYELNIFSRNLIDINELYSINAESFSNIDEINQNIIYISKIPIVIDKEKDESIKISGWAIDERAGGPAKTVFISIDGELNIPTLYGLERPDVVKVYDSKNFRYCGFMASFASSILDDGPHNLTIKIVSNAGDGYYTSNQIVSFICI